MRFTRHIVGLFVLTVALAGGLSSAGSASQRAPRVWMTTGDQKSLLAEQPATALGAPTDGEPTVTIDPGARYQPIEGFGASITDSSAHLLAASPYHDAT